MSDVRKAMRNNVIVQAYTGMVTRVRSSSSQVTCQTTPISRRSSLLAGARLVSAAAAGVLYGRRTLIVNWAHVAAALPACRATTPTTTYLDTDQHHQQQYQEEEER